MSYMRSWDKEACKKLDQALKDQLETLPEYCIQMYR